MPEQSSVSRVDTAATSVAERSSAPSSRQPPSLADARSRPNPAADSSSSAGEETDGAEKPSATNRSQAKSELQRRRATETPPLSAQMTLGSSESSAASDFSAFADSASGTMRTMDQIRHRLKQPSTASTMVTASSNYSLGNGGSGVLLDAPSTMSGFLRMRQAAREWRMKTWYCVLFNDRVSWYASKKDAQVAKRLQGQVRVVCASMSSGAGKIHMYPNAFVFTASNGHVYFCSAPTAADQKQWIEAMNGSVANSKQRDTLLSTGDSTLSDNQELNQLSIGMSASSSNSGSSSSAALECSTRDDDETFRSSSSNNLGLELQSSLRRAASIRSTGRLELVEKKASTELACSDCEIEFSSLRRRRCVCGGCGLSFCRWHCSKDVILSSGPSATMGTRATRVCDSCAHRQHFISFVVALTSTMVQQLKSAPRTNCSFLLACSHNCFSSSARSSLVELSTVEGWEERFSSPRCHHREWRDLQVLIAQPASFTALNLMCFLRKYQRMPWLFARTICLFIPIFETDPEALAEYWVQFVGMFVPLIQSVYSDQEHYPAVMNESSSAEHFHVTSDEQQASLNLYINITLAICRRSSSFALCTIWECLALYEDARLQGNVVCANYILLLIYLVSEFHGDSELVANIWLRDAPEPQADAIVCAMDDFLHLKDLSGNAAPTTLTSQWIHAMSEKDIWMWRQRIVRIMSRSSLSAAMSEKDYDNADDQEKAESFSAKRILGIFSPMAAEGEAFFTCVENAECDQEQQPASEPFAADNSISKEQLFNAEASFVHNLTAIAERLRHVTPASSRSKALPDLLRRLQQTLNSGDTTGNSPRHYQYLPLYGTRGITSSASAPKILRVVTDEGKVFSTRCRAPTMIVFEAILPESELAGSAVGSSSSQHDGIESAPASFPPQAKPQSLRKLARQESEMLDKLLCSYEEEGLTELIKKRDSPSEMKQPAAVEPVVDDAENEPPPEELSMEEARLVYEESMSASMLERGATKKNVETWAQKSERIKAASKFGDLPGWTLVSIIAKSFDDLRQEVFALQLMSTLQSIFEGNDLSHLYLRPYKILCTGANVGLIETLTDSLSIDAVKKQYGSLWQYFRDIFGNERSKEFQRARQTFVESMAASSVFCYLFQIKDRHNGNIMVDRLGHIMHIDFGFILGIAPGGAFSLEKDGPFKLTVEMVELMGGHESKHFQTFRQLFLEGILAARREYIKLLSLIHLTISDSPFPCFQAQSPGIVMSEFRRRLFLECSDEAASAMILRLVDKSYNNWGMRQYDKFQRSTNGILP